PRESLRDRAHSRQAGCILFVHLQVSGGAIMTNITRREALAGLASAGIAGLAAANNTFAQPAAAQEALPPAFAGKHAPVPLPFNPAKLTGISEKLITSHHDNNYAGAVKV